LDIVEVCFSRAMGLMRLAGSFSASVSGYKGWR